MGLLRQQVGAVFRGQTRASRLPWLCGLRSLRNTAAAAAGLGGSQRALVSLTCAVVLGCDSMCKHFQVFVFASRSLALYSESTPARVLGWISGEEQSGFKGEPASGLCKGDRRMLPGAELIFRVVVELLDKLPCLADSEEMEITETAEVFGLHFGSN